MQTGRAVSADIGQQAIQLQRGEGGRRERHPRQESHREDELDERQMSRDLRKGPDRGRSSEAQRRGNEQGPDRLAPPRPGPQEQHRAGESGDSGIAHGHLVEGGRGALEDGRLERIAQHARKKRRVGGAVPGRAVRAPGEDHRPERPARHDEPVRREDRQSLRRQRESREPQSQERRSRDPGRQPGRLPKITQDPSGREPEGREEGSAGRALDVPRQRQNGKHGGGQPEIPSARGGAQESLQSEEKPGPEADDAALRREEPGDHREGEREADGAEKGGAVGHLERLQPQPHAGKSEEEPERRDEKEGRRKRQRHRQERQRREGGGLSVGGERRPASVPPVPPRRRPFLPGRANGQRPWEKLRGDVV